MGRANALERLDHVFFENTYRDFADSPYGKELDGRPRWDRYRPEHVAPEEWVRLLGPDIDNLEHHAYSYCAAYGFIVATNEFAKDTGGAGINDEEATILLLAALCNDWGEAEIGDINYELITVNDKVVELQSWRKIFSEIVGEEFVKHRYMVEDVLFGSRETKLGHAWDAIERITYLHDALAAFQLSKTSEDPILSSHLRWMTAGALSNQTSILLEYARQMPQVHAYLDAHQDEISEAYDVLEPTIFAAHGQVEKTRLEQYMLARLTWQRRETVETSGKSSIETHDRGIFGTGTNFESRFLPDLDSVQRAAEAVRTLGLKIVLTSGSFDMWHIGHARYLELARAHGDFLMVGVDSDEKIQRRKGPNKPVVPESERLEIVAHDRSVDALTVKKADDPKWALIKAVRPDTLILTAETYTPQELEGLTGYCGRVVILPPQATTSTSARLRQLHMEMGKRLVEVLPAHIEAILKEIIRNG